MLTGMSDYRWRMRIVKLMQRRATIAVALAFGGASAPSLSEAQSNRNLPGADTPRLLVVVFASRDRLLGVQAADAVRSRLASVSSPRQLYLIPKEQMVSFLESSGYKADSSLGLTDLKELAKGLRADEIIAGLVSRGVGATYRIESRLMLAVDPSKGQPLPVVETANLSDAGRQIERALGDARKQLADNRACENHIRAGAIDKAIVAANAGIAKYANATLARLCLANAFQASKQTDSVLKVTDEIRRLDPRSSFAFRLAFLAYKDKADQEQDPARQQGFRESSVRALVSLLALEPSNPSLQNQVITELAKLGRPSVALPIVDTLLHHNPGDPQLLRQKWLLMLQAATAADSASKSGAFARAIAGGEEMVKADTTLADSVYYFRQIAAAMATSPQRGAEYAAKGVQKFPNNQDFWWIKARAERSAGQVQTAQGSVQRLLSLNPKYPSANVLLGQLFLELNMVDSAVALARRAVAAGEDAKTWGSFLLAPANAAVKKAQESSKDSIKVKDGTAVADWEAALALSQEADKVNPSATSKFFVGVSSFQVGIDAVTHAQKAKSCPLAKKAQDMFLLTQTHMPAGGSIDPATAQQVLGYVAQYAPAADQMVKQYCK